jgi:RAQPRD family integrative conjugative element protein
MKIKVKLIQKMRKNLGCFSLLALLSIPVAMASPEQERVYVLQLLHQIDALELTLSAAQKEQSPDARIQFHYTAYRDSNGELHNGVLEDLQLIRRGVEEHLSESPEEPRLMLPIQGDYMSNHTHQEQHHE